MPYKAMAASPVVQHASHSAARAADSGSLSADVCRGPGWLGSVCRVTVHWRGPRGSGCYSCLRSGPPRNLY